MSKNLKQRKDIAEIYKWDLESMYKSKEDWEKDLNKSIALSDKFAQLENKFTKSAKAFLEGLKLKDELWQTIEKAFVYARMKRDEDNRNEQFQAMCDKAMSTISVISSKTSFSTPEILNAGKDKIDGFFRQLPELGIYRFQMDDILRQKAHVLSHEEENLMAQMSQLNPATNDIFTMLNNADMTFGEIENEKGEIVPLTHGNYITFMESKDARVRKDAFQSMYKAYQKLINTLATCYNYNTKTDVVSAKIRKFESARQAALSGDNIPLSVYDNLVDVVNEYLPVLHKYIELRKKVLKVDELNMQDVYVPLVDIPDRKIPYADSLKLVSKALAPLGEEYVREMNNGFESGWIDVYESEGKTSGAYSFGSYDSKPYVLLNYTDTLKDVFTLAHEIGHSMHSFYTRKTQPFIYGGHSIFTAEVASTVNENLLMKYLLNNEEDNTMKKYLINMHIEGFRTTLFRQTMFAEFEKITHDAVEEGQPLTAHWLCSQYESLNKKYFGPAVVDDEFIKYEWSRIPHFYNAFYVYKYATGYSAATAIADIILEKGSKDYIEFLKTGEKDYPIELLKIAGVDMSSTQPIINAMKSFKALVDEFERIV